MTQGTDLALWYVGRGTAVMALLMLTASVVIGILVRSPRRPLELARASWTDIHRTASLTGVVLVAIHVSTLLLDPYSQLKVIDLVVPFVGSYRPLWLGLGTVAVDVLAAVTITALLRHRVGNRIFRVVHWGAYALWVTAFAHAVGSGTDRGSIWFLAIAIGCAVTVWSAVVWRTSEEFDRSRRRAVKEKFARTLA